MTQIAEKIITDLQPKLYEPPSAFRMDRTMNPACGDGYRDYWSCLRGTWHY